MKRQRRENLSHTKAVIAHTKSRPGKATALNTRECTNKCKGEEKKNSPPLFKRVVQTNSGDEFNDRRCWWHGKHNSQDFPDFIFISRAQKRIPCSIYFGVEARGWRLHQQNTDDGQSGTLIYKRFFHYKFISLITASFTTKKCVWVTFVQLSAHLWYTIFLGTFLEAACLVFTALWLCAPPFTHLHFTETLLMPVCRYS